MLRQRILIWGASGHALVVADTARLIGIEVVGFIDNVNPDHHGKPFAGAHILGGREVLDRPGLQSQTTLLIAIGDCKTRMALANEVVERGFRLATVVHPSAIIARDVSVGSGSFVAAGAVINPGVHIGSNAIINTGACIDHECRIAEGVHIGPGAHLGGRVRVECGAWIGIGAAIRDHVSIGAAAMVGMGAVVVKDVAPATTVLGIPARVLSAAARD